MDEAAFLRIVGDLSHSDALDQADVDRLAPLYEVVDADADPIGSAYEELNFELDRDVDLLWCKQMHRERPSFTPRLLRDVQAFQQRVKARYAGVEAPPIGETK